MVICSVDGCERLVTTRGWCTAHYQRWLRTGDMQADVPISRKKQPEICTVEGCDRRAQCRRLCASHYKRWQVHGDVQPQVPLSAERQRRPCMVEGCDDLATERGWCHSHYLRWVRLGDVQPDIPLGRRRQPEVCTVDGCNRDSSSKGLCSTHRQRLSTFGDVRADLPIRVVTGEGSLSHGYWKVPVPEELRHLTNGERGVGEHRLVMAQHLGRPLHPDEVVHHKNGNRTDNRIENLELWSTYQPKGQRVEDKVAYAVEMLRRYRPELLAKDNEEAGAK